MYMSILYMYMYIIDIDNCRHVIILVPEIANMRQGSSLHTILSDSCSSIS